MRRRAGPLIGRARGRGQKGVVRHLDLVVWGVVYGARIAVLGGWGEKLSAGHRLVDGGRHDLGLLWQDGVDGHSGVGCALLEFRGTQLPADEVLAASRVCALVLLLKLLQVLHLLNLLSLLLHDVGLWTQSGALDPLVVHHLRQGGSRMAVVEGSHHSMLPSLTEDSLTTGSSSQGVELARLAHVAVHPGHPITLAF